MSRLQEHYSDRVDFVHVNWDDPDSRDVISTFAVPRRSTYIILDPEGTVRWTFVGLLDEDAAAREIDRALGLEP